MKAGNQIGLCIEKKLNLNNSWILSVTLYWALVSQYILGYQLGIYSVYTWVPVPLTVFYLLFWLIAFLRLILNFNLSNKFTLIFFIFSFFLLFFFKYKFILMEVNYFTILCWFCHTSTWTHHRRIPICVPHPEPPSL